MFDAHKLPQFRPLVKTTIQVYQTKQQRFYFVLWQHAKCETEFSDPDIMKTKHCSQVITDKGLEDVISSITPQFVKLW